MEEDMSENMVRPSFASNRVLLGIYWLVVVAAFGLVPAIEVVARSRYVFDLKVFLPLLVAPILVFRLYAFLLGRFPTRWYMRDALKYLVSGYMYKVSEGVFYIVGIVSSYFGIFIFSLISFPSFDERFLWAFGYSFLMYFIAAGLAVVSAKSSS